MMNKSVMLLCAVMSWCYAMEQQRSVAPQHVGICTAQNKKTYQENRFYEGLVDGGNFYAVYGGHCCHRIEYENDDRDGSVVSNFLAQKLHHYFEKTSGSMSERMKATFKAVDEDEYVKNNGQCGASAAVVFMKDNKAYIAHVGDVRVLLASNCSYFNTIDHRPNRADEYIRIEDAKGIVLDDRVNGFLPVSRAFGDYNLGKNVIISEPEYAEITLTDQHNFLILATNGLWSVMHNDEVVTLWQKKQLCAQGVDAFAKLLALLAIKRGSIDNITVMLVDLLS